ncbi:MAG: N-acetylmuramoyl-L-alanine amidase [Cyclobacteriaceae bacterium]|nr:N-acetylmuramoyl-L-alanine amidase [Cyclobacteriaceae bacterium]
MEQTLLKSLTKASKTLGIPEPHDGRGHLATNNNGAKWKTRNVEKLQGLVMHQELGWGSVEGVARYHTGPSSHLHDGGVESISYSWAIRRDGQIVLCNDLDKATWSQGYKGRAGDENAEFISVMFEGMFKGEKVTDPKAGEPNDKQLLSGMVLWQVCKTEWDWDSDDLYGHYHFGKPACPGDTLQVMIDAIRSNREKLVYDFSTVTGRQQALKDLGYYAMEVDGKWGPGSKGALVRFQTEHHLEPDGIWGPNTEAAMWKALKNA